MHGQDNNFVPQKSAEHQGVIKTYLTISDKFFIPNLTLHVLHATIVMISHLVKKVPLQELLSATELSLRLV